MQSRSESSAQFTVKTLQVCDRPAWSVGRVREMRSLRVQFPLVQQAFEPQQARAFVVDRPVRPRRFPAVGLDHTDTLRAAADPDEGYGRAVFLLLLSTRFELELPQICAKVPQF